MEQHDDILVARSPHGYFRWMVLLAMVVLVDATLYRSHGYAGAAVFFPVALGLLLIGRGRIVLNSSLIIVATLLILLCASIVWAGSFGQIVAAVWLLIAANLAAQGVLPFVLETTIALAAAIPGGYEFFHGIQLSWRRVVLNPVDQGRPSRALNYVLPIVSVIVFGTVFVMANPDVIKEISTLLSDFFEQMHSWFSRFSATEIVIWCATFWLTGGLLCPTIQKIIRTPDAGSDAVTSDLHHPMYAPFRNTLITLNTLFVVYLLFEFSTLWFRKFPVGFHYSGYAHEGAAWLTVALALATLTLSLIFRGSMMNDVRAASLKKLAWAWSAFNFLLAASVYNRLMIYVDFNGMTRMRVIGFLGISAVAGGFILVLIKIAKQKNFIWLVRRQLWVLAFACYLYVALPVDLLVHRYNVAKILSGSPAPCVQISEHPISDDALPQLLPLLESNDGMIRDGVQAILGIRLQEMGLQKMRSSNVGFSQHWTDTQFGRSSALHKLQAVHTRLYMDTNYDAAEAMRKRFHEYAMQWW